MAKAEHELPSFGRAGIAFISGMAMFSGFIGLLVATFIEKRPGAIGFWTLATAGEIVAWRLKWMALPIAIAVIWGSARIIRSIKQNPTRFIGLRAARAGLTAAAAVTILIAALIGITVPARLRQRQDQFEAAIKARGYTLHRAFLEYRDLHGTFPTDPDKYVEALRTVPDPDGSIAEALRFVDPSGYEAISTVAAGPTKGKQLLPRGAALRNVSTATSAEQVGVSFTSYKLRLPSEHRFLGSDEEFVLTDGVIKKVSEISSTSSTSPRNQ